MAIGMEMNSCDVLDAIHWQTRNSNSKYGESMKVPCYLFKMATHSSILAWETHIDRGAWWAMVHEVTKSQTPLGD